MSLPIPLLGLVLSAQALPGSPSTGTGNNLDIEHYRPPTSPLGTITIEETKAQIWREWSIGLYVSYAKSPLVLFQDRLQIGEVVAHKLSGELVGSLGINKWLDVGASLPLTFYQTGDRDLPTGDLAKIGFRDMRLLAKVSLVRQEETGIIGVAIVPEITLPTGGDASFLGNGGVTFLPHLVLDRGFDVLWGVRGAGSIGIRLRPRAEIGNIEVEHELWYRLGAGVGLPDVLEKRPEVIAELWGTTGLSAPFEVKEQNPLEGSLGLKLHWDLRPGHELISTTGVAVGFTHGYGAPDFQLFAGIAYRRWMSDRDGDGIFDDDDLCPDDPEDKDNFEDQDGCPEPDNDRDGIPDVADRCPLDPEDIDGFEDIDGCPEPDNDKDGLPDVKDRCPNDPEDFDGFEDWDGCPEPDNDQDGVPDKDDRCPTEKETINGVDDEDGCPDEGEQHVEVTREKITIDTKIHFDYDSARIREESFSILNQVALTILANPQIKKLRVEGHCDERGDDDYNLVLSQKRAESVLEYLVNRGVPSQRLEAVGYGEQRPIVDGHDEAAWSKNRRVEFTILDQSSQQGGRAIEIPVEPPK